MLTYSILCATSSVRMLTYSILCARSSVRMPTYSILCATSSVMMLTYLAMNVSREEAWGEKLRSDGPDLSWRGVGTYPLVRPAYWPLAGEGRGRSLSCWPSVC